MPLDDECTNRWNSFLDLFQRMFFNGFHHKPPFFTSIWEKSVLWFSGFPPASYDAKATRESKDGRRPGGLQWQSATGWNLGGADAEKRSRRLDNVRNAWDGWKHPWVWLHPRKLTWNLKMSPWKTRFLLKTIIFRFHVSFQGCNGWFTYSHHPWKARKMIWSKPPGNYVPAVNLQGCTFLETNITSNLKMDGWKIDFLLVKSIFREVCCWLQEIYLPWSFNTLKRCHHQHFQKERIHQFIFQLFDFQGRSCCLFFWRVHVMDVSFLWNCAGNLMWKATNWKIKTLLGWPIFKGSC